MFDAVGQPIGTAAVPGALSLSLEAGATYFLAPAGNCGEALRNQVSGLTLVKVTNLDSALAALEEIRDGKPTTPCTSQ